MAREFKFKSCMFSHFYQKTEDTFRLPMNLKCLKRDQNENITVSWFIL